MNILLRELKANSKSLIIWSLCMVFLILFGMIEYASFDAVGQSANDFLNLLPTNLKEAMGMNGIDLTSVSGYYSVFYLYFMLLAGIHAIMLGAVIISKEEKDKTADFLYVKPNSRSKIITAKLAATFINILVLNLVILFSSIIFVDMYNKGDPINKQIIKVMFALFILQAIFASIGAAISALLKDTKKATSISTAVLLIAFILSMVIDLYNKIDFLKYFTPFKYFNAAELMRGASYNSTNIIISAGIIIVCKCVTYVLYEKRDIYS